MSEGKWRRYYAAAGETPRETLLQALQLLESEGRAPGRAVDLGCGTGRDTLELLRRGWRVTAIDAEPEAIGLLSAQPEAVTHGGALETVVASFDEAGWPEAQLVNASYSLPFCAPDAFLRVWAHIRSSLAAGGRFCGQLFGERDEWAGAADMTFHSRAEVLALLEGLEVDRLEEVEEDGETAVGERKHWHLFHLVARKP